MPSIQLAAIAFALGLALGGAGAWKATSVVYKAEVADQKIEAAAQLQAATERAIATERANIRLADQVEADHAASQTKLDRALADNRRLARDLGGLRDPGPRPGCGDAVPAGTTAAGHVAATATGGELPTASQGLLSRAASDFILELAAEADRAAEYAKACYRWASEISR